MKTNTCMNFAKRVVMMLAVVLIAGSAWAGKYTYDFTKVSTSYWTTDNGTTAVTATNVDGFYYMQSGYSGHHFTTGQGTSDNHNHKFNTTKNSECFLLGKKGEYLTLPSYSGEQITSITLKKGSQGSTSAKVNIYAGDNAASDESTISTGGTDFSIASAYQQSALRIKVTNEYNTSFAQIVINTTTACDKSVTIATNGTCSNASIKSSSSSSLFTCSDTESSREVTITITPATGYTAVSSDRLTVTGTAAEYVSGPTADGSDFKFVYRLAKNATGTTTFGASLSTLKTYTVTCAVNNSNYGSISASSVTSVQHGTSISASDNVLSVGSTDVTATAANKTADYKYAFSNWTNIPAGGQVVGNVTITANFSQSARTYTNYRTTCCAKYDVAKASVTGGTLEVDKTEACEGEEVSITATPDGEHVGGTIKVIETGSTPENDVTSTYFNAGTGKLTMPAFAVTVSATFDEPTSPLLTASGDALSENTLAFGDQKKGATSESKTFTITGSNLTAGVTWELSGDDASMFSVTPESTISKDDAEAGQTIIVTFTPTSVGAKTATLTFSSEGASDKAIALTGTGKWAVTWKVNESETPFATTLCADNATPSFPTETPTSCNAQSATFVGWTQTTWIGTIDAEAVEAKTEADKKVYTSAAGMPAVIDHITYHAVFANKTQTGTNEIKAQTLEYDTWTHGGSTTDKYSQNYRLFHNGGYVESADFDLSTLNKVKIYGGYYGGKDMLTMSIKDEDGNKWKDVTLKESNSQTNENTFDDSDATALSGTKKLRIYSTCGSAEGNGSGIRMTKVEIFVSEPVYTYSDYLTSCRSDVHTISVAEGIEGGSVEVATWGVEGEDVTLFATPSAGYDFGSWNVYKTGDTETTVSVSNSKFQMPTYDVTVSATFTAKPMTGLTLSETSLTKEKNAEAVTLTVTGYTPEDLLESQKTVNWSSSNTAVATVNNGIVNFVGAGTAVITAAWTEDDDVYATCNVNVYQWNLAESNTYAIKTAPENTNFTEGDLFNKSSFVIEANYVRSDDNTETKKADLGVADWTAKLGGTEILNEYEFQAEDDGKQLTLWVSTTQVGAAYNVVVTPVAKDYFDMGVWADEVAAIAPKKGTYELPNITTELEKGSEATCKDHNIFVGWTTEEFKEEPTGHVIASGTETTADNVTYYAVWASGTEVDVPAGYRLITSAPQAGDSVIMAAKVEDTYYAMQNSGKGVKRELVIGNDIVTNPNGCGFLVTAINNSEQVRFQSTSGTDVNYIHFNNSEINITTSTSNSATTITALDGGGFSLYANSKYLYMNNTKFTTSTDATPIYFFKKQAATIKVVTSDYIAECATRYTITYDINGGTDVYQNIKKKAGKKITLPEVTSRANHDFNGWRIGSTTYNAGDAYTVKAADAVEGVISITAQWTEWSKATVVFMNGDVTVETKENIYKNSTYNAPAAPEVAGKLFQGWSDGEHTYAAGAQITMTDPAETVTYNAIWKDVIDLPDALTITTADLANGKWVLVTAQSQIKEGDVVVVAATVVDGQNQQTFAMGIQHVDGNKVWREYESVTRTGDTIIPVDNVPRLFVQAGYGENHYSLYAINGTTGYLYYPGNNNYLNTGADLTTAASWAIAINANNEAEITNDASNMVLRYNKTSGQQRFSCYSSGQAAVSLYKWVKKITTDMNISDVTLTDAVIVTDGKTLTVDEDATLDNLTVENGGKVQIAENKQLDVQDFYIGGTHGKSGQVMNAENLHINGDAYFDFTLGVDVSTTEGAAKAEAQWHNFSIPFPVSATSGVYGWRNNQWKQLTNEVDYAIEDYHGELRKNGEYGWKKFRSIMTPGHTYSMTVNGDIQTYRFKKAGDYTFDADPTVGFSQHAAAEDKNAGWNGLGNMRLCYSSINNTNIAETTPEGQSTGRYVLVLNAEDYRYDAYLLSKINLTVGSAFFIQASADGTMGFNEAQATVDKVYAPARTQAKIAEPIMVTMSGERGTDHMYISADEDATSTYQIGRDMQRMFATSNPTTPLIYTMNYGGLKLAAEDAPMVNDQAVYTLQLYTPIAGEYTLQTEAVTDADVYLTYEGAIIWNISESEYTVDLSKGKNDGYGLLLRAKAPSVVTGVDQIDAKAGAQKVIIDEHVYILRGGQMYDVNGKLVK